MPDPSIYAAPPSKEALDRQAEQLARLRDLLAASQAKTGVIDPSLVAEFAQAQRAFIEGKIQLKQIQMAGSPYEEQQQEECFTEGTCRGEVKPPAPTEAPSLSPQEGARLLEASPQFWLTIIILLSVFLTLMHSPFSYQ